MTVYQTLTINVDPDPDAVEVRDHRGEKYLVAPVVAVAEGVLNGGFLPFQEIQKSAPGWNGAPVTITHPTDENGDFVPASNPEILEQYQIGFLANAEAVEPKLVGELWVNLGAVKWLTENANSLGEAAKAAADMLREGDALEVSTGYWHGIVTESGEFQGEEFEAVQVDLLPDHLALLPNDEGACNWEGDRTAAGCGAPRTNTARGADRSGPQTVGNWTSWSSGNGRQMSFATNSQTVKAARTTGIDVALHQWSYDADAIGATNLLDTSRTPDFDGTSSGEWSAPSLEDYVSGFGYEAVSSVDDLSADQLSAIAQTSLLGDSDAETFDELVFFPVVDPSTMELNENALDAVVSGRGSQADISDSQLESARGVARTLLEDEFDRDLDSQRATLAATLEDLVESADRDRSVVIGELASAAGIEAGTVNAIIRGEVVCPPEGRLESFADVLDADVSTLIGAADQDGCSYSDNVAGWRAKAADACLRALGIDADLESIAGQAGAGSDSDPAATGASGDVSYAVHTANCSCDRCTMSNGNSTDDDPDDRIERLAENTEFSADELEEMDEDVVSKIDESLENIDGGSGTANDGGTDDGAGGDGGGDDRIETLEQQIEEMRSTLEAQQSDEREQLVDAITANSTFEEDELPEDVEKLESMAEKIGTQVATAPNFGGQAAGKDPSGGDLDLDEVDVGGAFNRMDEADAESGGAD